MPLTVHFLNVGRGDCTIIQFPSGRVAMIDIDHLRTLDPSTRDEILQVYHESQAYLIGSFLAPGSRASLDSTFLGGVEKALTDPLAYYDTHIGAHVPIFRLVITHPDMDHMTGLFRLVVQERREVLNFWHTGLHDFNLADTSWGNGCPYDQRDWEIYKLLRAGGPGWPTSLVRRQGFRGECWTEDGIDILAPTAALVQRAIECGQPNVLSMVLRITYRGRSIVLGGDATGEEVWPAIEPLLGPVTVLKASHHGRKSGYYGPAVKRMSPWLTITSVGEREYDATSNYRRYSERTVSLRKSGDVSVRIDDDGQWYISPNVEAHWKVKTPEPTLADIVGLLGQSRFR
jgi:competence protein ComEC